MRNVNQEPGFANSFKNHLKGIPKKESLKIFEDFKILVDLLKVDSQSIPSRYKVHKLKNKSGLFEAHLGGRGSDTLLLFRKDTKNRIPTLSLVRVCTHYELELVKAMAEVEDVVITASYMSYILDEE